MVNKNNEICNQFLRLVDVMETLRSPGGCSWDRKQSHETLKKYVLEEAQEVVDAIDSGDLLNLREELGDLLMLIVFNAQIAQDNGTFTIVEVCSDICKKLIHRHPHVFGKDATNIAPEKVVKQWGEIKKDEKAENRKVSTRMIETLRFKSSMIATIKVQQEAANVGFDFPDANEALKKVFEEAEEVKELIIVEDSKQSEAIEEEIGDLMFAAINVARLSNVDPSAALRKAAEKFTTRFTNVETLAEQNGGFEGKTIKELDVFWDAIKVEEKNK